MKKIKISYSGKDYIYYITNFQLINEKEFDVVIKDSKDNLWKWVKNNKNDKAKKIICNVTVINDGNIKEFNNCHLESLQYVCDDDVYVLRIEFTNN